MKALEGTPLAKTDMSGDKMSYGGSHHEDVSDDEDGKALRLSLGLSLGLGLGFMLRISYSVLLRFVGFKIVSYIFVVIKQTIRKSQSTGTQV